MEKDLYVVTLSRRDGQPYTGNQLFFWVDKDHKVSNTEVAEFFSIPFDEFFIYPEKVPYLEPYYAFKESNK